MLVLCYTLISTADLDNCDHWILWQTIPAFAKINLIPEWYKSVYKPQRIQR